MQVIMNGKLIPVFVVAASGNMDSAIEMTKERHAA